MTGNQASQDQPVPSLRQRAEEEFRAGTVRLQAAASSEDAQRLLDELQVHQIELEMQNEELRRAQANLDESKAYYFDLYDLAPVGYVTLNREGLIQDANLTAATLLGVTRRALFKQPLSRFVLAEDLGCYFLSRKNLLEGRSPQVCELRLVKMDGTTFWTRLEMTDGWDQSAGQGQVHGGVPLCRAVLSDITVQKQAEQGLRESEAKLKAILEMLPVGISILDAERNISYENPALERIMDIPKAQMAEGKFKKRTYLRPDGTRMPEDEFASVQAIREQRAVSNVETGVVKEDGSIAWTSVSAAPVAFPDWKVVIVTADITKRKRAEEEIHNPARFPAENPYPILRIARDGTLIYINQAGSSLPAQGTLRVGQAVPSILRAAVVEALDTGMPQAVDVHYGERVYSWSVAPIQAIGVANLYGSDVTERRQRENEMEAIVSISAALRLTTTRAEMVTIFLGHLLVLLDADNAAMVTHDLNSGETIVERGLGKIAGMAGRRFPPGVGLSAQVMKTGQSYLNDDASRDASFSHPPQGGELHALACVPLITQDQAIGAIWVARENPITKVELRLLSTIANIAANALLRASLMETLEQRVADRTRELAALYRVTSVATQSLPLQTVLEKSLALTLEAMQLESGAIQLLEEDAPSQQVGGETRQDPVPAADGSALRLAVQQGITTETAAWLDRQPFSAGLSGWVSVHGRSLVSVDMANDPRAALAAMNTETYAYLGVPMWARGRILGVLSVFRKAGEYFSAEEIALLSTIADQIAVAVENDRLGQQARMAAVMEERQRLAHELHDSATQALYSLSLFASAAKELARVSDQERLQHTLDRIDLTALQALKEMRLIIYELHPPSLEGEGLVTALQQRLEAVEGRVGIKTRLLVEGEIELPAPLAAELNRIAQEALNNILKHAAASKVTIRLSATNQYVVLEITDDGKGFDLKRVANPGGLGLHSLSERAEKLGGTLNITSTPGEGTRVKVRTPREKSQ